MDEHGTGTGRLVPRPALLAAVLLLVSLCSGCDLAHGQDDDARDIQRMLDRRAAAVLRHDERAFLSVVDRDATRYRAEQRQVIDNLSRVPVRTWRYRLLDLGGSRPASGDGRRVAAEIRLSFRLGDRPAEARPHGSADAPLTAVQRLTLTERDDRWYVAAEDRSETGGRRGVQQLWDQGPIEAVRGRHSLVLGVGREKPALRELAAKADHAVGEVTTVWPRGWDRRVVVLAPHSREAMAALLGRPADAVRDVAAVTTGEAGRVGADRSGQVIVNPEAYPKLSEFGRQVVLTHETAHVATRPSTSPSTPMWLSEGYADWVGYRASDRPAERLAPELAGRIAAGEGAGTLPEDDEFGFDGDSDRRASAYERGWLACRMIAQHWGGHRLAGFYREVGSGPEGQKGLDIALRSELGLSHEEFVDRWRAYSERELD